MMHEELQNTLHDEERVSAVFVGPIHQTEQSCLLALTNLRAIVILREHPALRERKGFVVLDIPKAELSFAQREDFRAGHLYGVGGPKFGMYVDGFPYRITISSELSEAQREDLDALLLAWGGQVQGVDREEALARRPGMFEYSPLHVRILGSFILSLFFGLIFMGSGLARGLSRCRIWLWRLFRRQ